MSLPLCVRIDARDKRSAEALTADGWRTIEELEIWFTNIAYPIAENHGFEIREARKKDNKACQAIFSQHQLSRLHMDAEIDDSEATAERAKWLAESLTKDTFCLVAEHRSVIVGFITIAVYPDCGVVKFFGVDKEHRGCGVGKALVRDVIRRAKTDLVAGTQAHNEAARGLYASLGFECVGRQTTFHKTVAI